MKFNFELPPLPKIEQDAAGVFKGLEAFMSEVNNAREKIITAFIAETGLYPSEVEQVVEHRPDGTTTWYLQKRMSAPKLEFPVNSKNKDGNKQYIANIAEGLKEAEKEKIIEAMHCQNGFIEPEYGDE